MLIALNHKANLTLLEIQKYEKILRNYEVVVFPQLLYMNLFNNGIYSLGSQTINIDNITGGISSKALKSLNTKYVLVNHYDQKEYLNENEYMIGKKIDEISSNQMKPILCIGESLEEKSRNKGFYVVEKELNKILSNIKTNINNIVIAYEPRWNPEKDLVNNLDYINEMMFFIKSYIKDNYGYNVKVLYDGNITPNNIQIHLKLNILDGFIIEDASTDIYDVINIYENING